MRRVRGIFSPSVRMHYELFITHTHVRTHAHAHTHTHTINKLEKTYATQHTRTPLQIMNKLNCPEDIGLSLKL